MTELPTTDPTVRVSETPTTLTVISTATHHELDPVVSYRTRIQKSRGQGFVDVSEAKKYPHMGAFSEWSETLIGSGGLVERELRNRVFQAGVRGFEEAIKE